MQSLQGLGTQRSPAVLKKVFPFWYAISFLGGLGGGKAQCLKKIYRPRAIFKTFDPPLGTSQFFFYCKAMARHIRNFYNAMLQFMLHFTLTPRFPFPPQCPPHLPRGVTPPPGQNLPRSVDVVLPKFIVPSAEGLSDTNGPT